MRLSRRTFLKVLLAAAITGPRQMHAESGGRLDLRWLDLAVPVWLFDDASTNRSNVQALAAEIDREANRLVVLCSEGRRLTLDPGTSVRSIEKRNGNRPTRRSMLLKRIISYCLDTAFKKIANGRNPAGGASLKQAFDAMQDEDRLEAITVGAMYDLLSTLEKRSRVSSVVWDPNRRVFVVD